MWHCRCECGNEKDIASSDLQNGSAKSCGCLQRELTSKRRKKYNTYDLTGGCGVGYTTKGEEFYFDLEDYDKIKNYCWRKRRDKYLDAKLCDGTNSRILMHKVILNGDSEIDHINGVRHDNRKNNLRYAEINGLNRNNQNKILQSNNTSGVKGVAWHSRDNIWEAYISINHKQIYLGRFDKFEDAASVRKEAEEEYFGEWSLDNSRNIKQ